jgi:hypothetical protein
MAPSASPVAANAPSSVRSSRGRASVVPIIVRIGWRSATGTLRSTDQTASRTADATDSGSTSARTASISPGMFAPVATV